MVEILVARGVMAPDAARRAESLHLREGGWMGTILLAHALASREAVYSAWAKCLGLPMVDLILEPPDRSLIGAQVLSQMLTEHWCPWRIRRRDGQRILIVASADPEAVPVAALTERFNVAGVDIMITTDWDVIQATSLAAAGTMAGKAADFLTQTRPEYSAHFGPSLTQVAALVTLAAVMIGIAAWDPFVGLATLLWVLSILFTGSILAKVFIFWRGAVAVRKDTEARLRNTIAHGKPLVLAPVPDDELPVYTVLIPCYHEANVLPRLVENLRHVEYPRSRLQVLLLLEVDDTETIEAAKQLAMPGYFHIVLVPEGQPKTKPRACNIGLEMARGEFLVIYDAEDRPDPMQLRDIIAQFRESPDSVACIQARLNYFNSTFNFITRMFTLEYSMWFDYFLLGLDALGVPIPLGGTSNHFRVSVLRELGGWDPWNVTEDADLGIRASALGYTIGTSSSTTWEEACSAWWPWVRQRTRWVKGYIVTSMVHTRSPVRLFRSTGWRGVASLFFFIAGTPITFLLNPIMLATGLYGIFALPLPNFRLPGALVELSVITLVLDTAAMLALTALAARRRREWSIIGYAALNPFYWLLHSWAAWRALFQTISNPSGWEKTPHGLSE